MNTADSSVIADQSVILARSSISICTIDMGASMPATPRPVGICVNTRAKLQASSGKYAPHSITRGRRSTANALDPAGHRERVGAANFHRPANADTARRPAVPAGPLSMVPLPRRAHLRLNGARRLAIDMKADRDIGREVTHHAPHETGIRLPQPATRLDRGDRRADRPRMAQRGLLRDDRRIHGRADIIRHRRDHLLNRQSGLLMDV
ncbi:unnamed protein product [Acanthosepion pharaonis]|uniref:Uncharacterized protein n=1 Tax=Acanthosepion pharaonis TaxID=158019 RepID=A0A812DCN9_ACAPH|nr:unnamed protein product [Sepia pharaonis]